MDTTDIALVIPLDGDRMHLVEQHRHRVGGRRWEFPSGDCDAADADPASTAARELREETGLVARHLTRLGTLEVMPSTLDVRCHVFLATGLTEGPTDRDPGEHDMTSAWIARDDVERMMRDGAMTDAKSMAAYALLLLTRP